MTVRILQSSTKRKKADDGTIEREWAALSIAIPPALADSLGWQKGDRIDITITATKGKPGLLLQAVDE